MPVNSIFPQITMELYETDIEQLQKFIEDEKAEEEFTEKYLILYNFAEDCRYSKCIQPELIRYLLPFYLKAAEQAVITYKNKIAADIYFEFNSALFCNQKNFEYAVGEKNYRYIMEYYMKQTIKIMEIENTSILHGISLFNTTAAFHKDNIRQLLEKIFEGSLKIKFSFFKYLSVLLFKENDNLLAVNEPRAFWTSDIWDFDSQCFDDFFWNNDIIEYFDKTIDRERIEGLFKEVKPFLHHILEPELMELFSVEMKQSFDMGIFQKRKKEYLLKMNRKSEKYKYWDNCF